jgi:hypothetical protein
MKQRNPPTHTTARDEKKPYLFSPREIARSIGKKEFESFSKKNESFDSGTTTSLVVRQRRHCRHGIRKNGDGLAACPHPAVACPHPAAASSTLLSFWVIRRR